MKREPVELSTALIHVNMLTGTSLSNPLGSNLYKQSFPDMEQQAELLSCPPSDQHAHGHVAFWSAEVVVFQVTAFSCGATATVEIPPCPRSKQHAHDHVAF